MGWDKDLEKDVRDKVEDIKNELEKAGLTIKKKSKFIANWLGSEAPLVKRIITIACMLGFCLAIIYLAFSLFGG